MKRYYAMGGLNALTVAQPPAANYYTYGMLPPEIWPATNPPPPTQAEEQEDMETFGPGADTGEYAEGGMAEASPLDMLMGGQGAPRAEGPVAGPGTGRSDEIDARLSDGEYVIDAETVALLGDGSTAAGAEILDRMREQIRAHKGKALAKGEFSPPARAPLDYILGEE
jgi:hypothetical protein